MTVAITGADWAALLPAASIGLAGLVVLVADLLSRTFVSRYAAIAIALLGAIAAAAHLWGQYTARSTAFFGAFNLDEISVIFQAIVLLGTVGSVILYATLGDRRTAGGSIALMLWSACGAMLMAGAANLMVVFLGLELLSLALYVLCGMERRAGSRESSLKYLILSSTATGFLLYGMALLFGATGSVALSALALGAHGANPVFWVGAGLFLIGLAFKLSLVPFHTWAPDVYEGAPLPVTAFMSVVTKAGVLAVLIRLAYTALPAAHAAAILLPIWVVAAISMVIGNTGMLAQTDLKRLLAYSGIAQIGYVLAAVAGSGAGGFNAAVYYFTAYSLMNLGAFAVASMLSTQREEGARLDNYAGLGYRRPWVAFAMTTFLLAMAGLPPTAGFLGKVLILRSSVATGYPWLGALLIVGTAISLYAYGRVVRTMFDPQPRTIRDERPFAPLAAISAAVCAAAVVVLTFIPFPR